MQNKWGKLKKQGAAAPRRVCSILPQVFLYIWTIILVIRMIIWATSMIRSIILSHPKVRQKLACLLAWDMAPTCTCWCALTFAVVQRLLGPGIPFHLHENYVDVLVEPDVFVQLGFCLLSTPDAADE